MNFDVQMSKKIKINKVLLNGQTSAIYMYIYTACTVYICGQKMKEKLLIDERWMFELTCTYEAKKKKKKK